MDKQIKDNPFLYGFPININELPSRKEVINFLAQRLRAGKSAAIIGEPRIAKTSMIDYLLSPDNREMLYGDKNQSLIFSRINCQIFPSEITTAQFWEFALSPLLDGIKNHPDSELNKAYAACKEDGFGYLSLNGLFRILGISKKHYILILDEFDVLLTKSLNTYDFWSGLRAVSELYGSLAILISSRYPLEVIQSRTRSEEDMGSPTFNLYSSTRLTTLSFEDVEILLGNYFSPLDRQYIYEVSGGHPFLLQLSASMMWEEFSRNNTDRYKRHLAVGEQVRENSRLFYSDLWESWTGAIRKVVVIIGLSQTPLVLSDKSMQTFDFGKDLAWLSPEVHLLERTGLIEPDKSISSGYKFTQKAMLWWLADELVRILREDITFENWLLDRHYIGGPMTRSDLKMVKGAAKVVGGWLEKGATTLVEAYAKSLIK